MSDFKSTDLIQTIHFLASKGFCPATSSNFSFKHDDGSIVITQSGIDKTLISVGDLMTIDSSGNALTPKDAKPSAETLIHTELYKNKDVGKNIGAVLHTHSPASTVLSRQFLGEGKIVFSDYEILKGLRGNTTHAINETLPIVENSQNMDDINNSLNRALENFPNMHGFLIAGHGLYTWARDIATAKRHIEVFEFLFECLIIELQVKQ